MICSNCKGDKYLDRPMSRDSTGITSWASVPCWLCGGSGIIDEPTPEGQLTLDLWDQPIPQGKAISV